MNCKKVLKSLAVATAAIGLSSAAQADITTTDLVNPNDETDIWGQKIEGLGELGNEVALVFKKTGTTMTWEVPARVGTFDYLLVAGGGGGASGTWGAGGGGGGVVTGTVSVASSGMTFYANVGAGGAGGPATNPGTGSIGGDSMFGTILDDVTNRWVRAYGGGNGRAKNNGVAGGSGSGASPTANKVGGAAKAPTINAGVSDYLTYFAFGNKGADYTGSNYKGGGGGGAGAAATGNGGGQGLRCSITGTSQVYGSGGGGGFNNLNYDNGGTNAGQGGGNVQVSTSGTAGFGGGGGGGGKNDSAHLAGGAGGSGVIVFRYRVLSGDPVLAPVVESVVYNGELQVPVIAASSDYTVTVNNGGINVGEYDVVLELTGSGTVWADTDSSAPRTNKFVITKAPNSWVTVPALSKTDWEFGDDPAEVTMGVALNGVCTLTYDTDLSEMPTAAGGHTAHFVVTPDGNHEAISKDVAFSIAKRTNSWVVTPSITPDTWAFDATPGVLAAAEATYGASEMTVTYSDGDEPDYTTLGSHTITYTVPEGDTYKGISKVVTYTVTKKVNGWTFDPVVPSTWSIEDDAPDFIAPTSTYGTVTVYYDNDPSITERPTTRGKHYVTYVVEEGGDYQAYTQTIAYNITYKAIVDPDRPGQAYGYRIPGLGVNQDEVALVFTNTSYNSGDQMYYQMPEEVNDIQFLVVGGGGSGALSGNAHGAGGGGAGAVTNDTFTFTDDRVLTVYVGNGGVARTSSNNGQTGGASRLAIGYTSFKMLGGGGGGNCGVGLSGGNGGGGGCNMYNQKTAADYVGGAGTQGFPGGDAIMAQNYQGAGGGGAGGAGYNYNVQNGKGGPGIVTTILDTEMEIAGGGGGSHAWEDPGNGSGIGGGGYGRLSANGQAGSKFGAGGGGSSGNGDYHSGAGYRGVVIVRYTATKPQNFWDVYPSISTNEWSVGGTPGVLVNGVARHGNVAVTYTKNGVDQGTFSGTLPTEAGEYVISYDMRGITDYYADPTPVTSVSFTITSDAPPAKQGMVLFFK